MSRRFARPGALLSRELQAPGQPITDAAGLHLPSEFEHLLSERGCPSCGCVAEAERSFFAWFEIETITAAEMQARLRAAIGMCPAHSRRLVDQIGEGHIMTTILHEALTGARQALRGQLDRAGCPACAVTAFAAERSRRLVLEGLADPSNARRYEEHEGFCLPHLLDAAKTAEAATLRTLAERLLATLEVMDPTFGLEPLTGTDEDALPRARWRRLLPDPPAAESTIERLCLQLQLETCPVCVEVGLAERGYLDWFVQQTQADDRSLHSDPGEFCAHHLHDVSLCDRASAQQAAKRKRAARAGELKWLLDRLAGPSAPTRRGRQATRQDLDEVRRELVSPHFCAACHARRQSERTCLELVLASLPLTDVRERYDRTHGLCVRHALQAKDEKSSRVFVAHLDARLGVLAWEVDETRRKYAWACRHEPAGPEGDAWARALVQLDGEVFEGGPAVVAAVPTRDGRHT